ncbi:Gfo/Idh/MocA family protein [Pelagicoccus mobilis]|uniref:Gfo/Idh/MocA family oxidoreductase n=1 Tax=Pelagicoccus mobilis TaxID=415221 RepID=A0A934S2L7_9BACT|nr:Gfo/Idh/MocA family oxidoreductase [Pelagicoccus mobilis]MBK1880050.1 Gfo/Idh/MocA family oxidoreductase [Pelagicoccus mobilis]
MNRRNFISKTTAATALAAIQPFHILKGQIRGANERLNIAFIGAGGKGRHAIKSLEKNPLVNYAAFADVNDSHAAETYKEHPEVPRYRDFRVMLDKHDKEIDAVIISTPDHMHHYPAMICMQRGKHVYLEKPLAHSIQECRELAAMEKETGLACQMGNQGHSRQGIQLLQKWIDAGILGDVTEVVAWNPGGGTHNTKQPKPEPIPSTLDWDLWLGPTKCVPYSSIYCPATWRWWFDYGHGTLGDWACHNMDAPYLVLGLGLPSSVQVRTQGANTIGFPSEAEVVYQFPMKGRKEPLTFKWYSGTGFGPQRPSLLEAGRDLGHKSAGGTLIYGTDATVMMNSHASSTRIIPETRMQELARSLPRAAKRSNHFQNFILACKGEEKTRSNFEYGARLTEVMHYGNIATHLNRDLKIDTQKGKILGDSKATKLMSSPKARKGWAV